jgi:hypothetical protein
MKEAKAMSDLLTDTRLILDQAERMHAMALGEADKKKQRVMFAIAEHYYLLHDGLLELGQMEPGANIVPLSAAARI